MNPPRARLAMLVAKHRFLVADWPERRVNGRETPAVRARWVAMLCLREDLGWSYPRIGRALGRHHSTVIHGVTQARRQRETDADFASVCAEVREVLQP